MKTIQIDDLITELYKVTDRLTNNVYFDVSDDVIGKELELGDIEIHFDQPYVSYSSYSNSSPFYFENVYYLEGYTHSLDKIIEELYNFKYLGYVVVE